MENEILTKIEEQGVKIEAIYTSVEKTRKYFLTTMWITIIMFALPLLGLLIIIPMFISSYLNSF